MYWLPVILILPYLILLLKNFRSLLQIKTFNPSTDPSTFVSVIIACRNEQKNLPVLLNSISRQNYPEHLFEVIVVDDRSTDGTLEIAETFKEISNFRILTLNNIGAGKKQALRTGIATAKGNLIITTDADCTMGNNWIRTIAAFYEMFNPVMIICPVRIEPLRGFFGRFQELEFMSLQGITAGTALSNDATMCNGANLAFTRKAYWDHSDSMHDEISSGDDVFLLHSLKSENNTGILWLESYDSLVKTKPAATYMSFLKQRSRWLSKGKAYKDRNTILLGVVTFVAIVLQLSYFIAMFFHLVLIWVFLSVLILKSIPDFLILFNTTGRYFRRNLIWWFLPAQMIYPFYVLSVVLYTLIFTEDRKANFPFQKET
jgi:glycosyltransferase involved in cell wall biosynthesis